MCVWGNPVSPYHCLWGGFGRAQPSRFPHTAACGEGWGGRSAPGFELGKAGFPILLPAGAPGDRNTDYTNYR